MITRRQFIRSATGAAVGAAALPVLDACSGVAGGGTSGGGSKNHLAVSWWGGSDRAKRTQKVISLYEKKHGATKISAQFTAWSGYWQKMDTLAAGAGLPDVMQMDMAYIGEYTRRGQIVDLSKYKSGPLDLGDFDQDQLAQGTVQGKLTGISLGGNIPAMPYNAAAIKAAGMAPPADDVTWDGYAKYLSKIAKKLPSGMYPSDDGSGIVPALEVWVRQRGTELWTKDGKLAFTKSQINEWFQYWEDLRKAKLIVPGKVVVAYSQIGTPDASPLVKKQCAFTQTWSNFLGQYQILMKDDLALMRFPQGGKQAGDYVKASQLFSVSSKDKDVKAAADFIGFFTHDPQAVKTLGVERGVPGSAAARKLLEPTLKPYDAAQIRFFDSVGPKTRAKTVLDPAGAGAVGDALTRATQSISLGKQSVDAATNAFWDQAQHALRS